jgi:hypothetical protein
MLVRSLFKNNMLDFSRRLDGQWWWKPEQASNAPCLRA